MNEQDHDGVGQQKKSQRNERLALLLIIVIVMVPSMVAWSQKDELKQEQPNMLTLWARTEENGGWDPGVLTIAANTSVRLRLVALDVVHGFAIDNPNGSTIHPLLDSGPIISGEAPVILTIPPLPAGTYQFSCSISCSQLHTSQTGILIVR